METPKNVFASHEEIEMESRDDNNTMPLGYFGVDASRSSLVKDSPSIINAYEINKLIPVTDLSHQNEGGSFDEETKDKEGTSKKTDIAE